MENDDISLLAKPDTLTAADSATAHTLTSLFPRLWTRHVSAGQMKATLDHLVPATYRNSQQKGVISFLPRPVKHQRQWYELISCSFKSSVMAHIGSVGTLWEASFISCLCLQTEMYHLMQGIISFKLLVHFICYVVIHARKGCRCTNATFWSVLWPWLEPSRGFVLMFNADYWGLTAMKESLFDGHDPAPVGD